MRDRRSVDELSIEELERILIIRKREERQTRLRRMEQRGRRMPGADPVEFELDIALPIQHEAAARVAPLEPPVTYDITGDVPRFEDEIEAANAYDNAAEKYHGQFATLNFKRQAKEKVRKRSKLRGLIFFSVFVIIFSFFRSL